MFRLQRRLHNPSSNSDPGWLCQFKLHCHLRPFHGRRRQDCFDSLRPVSYTHLGVYKRQSLPWLVVYFLSSLGFLYLFARKRLDIKNEG